MSLKRYVIGVVVLLSIVSAPIFADLMRDERVIDGLVKQQIAPLQQQSLTWQGTEVVTSDYRSEGDWVFGISVVKVPQGIHGEPDMRLFLAQRDGSGQWQVALEYTPQFYAWMAQIPDSLIGFGAKQMLISDGFAMQQNAVPLGASEARLSLPWATGTTWQLIGGPHGNNGDSVRPWTALDLNPDNNNTSEKILAAREGYVYRSSQCPNYVRVDHADGWSTGYYHVKNEQVVNGQYIERGTWLGYTSAYIGCGGWASGAHVHFSLKYNNTFININGTDVGGWTVYEGNNAYDGCMVRLRDGKTVCKPVGQVYNDGSIGSGYFDQRYDYDNDAKPDLWAINQRDPNTLSTSMQIVSGGSLGTVILNSSTGMPQQPEWLNTAFASADYDGDNIPDLWVIHRWDSANRTAFRIMSGTAPQFLIADEITALPMYDNSVSFAVADYNRDGMPDLWAINPRDAAKGGVAVQIINGAIPSQVMTYSGTPLSSQSAYADITFAAGDYDADGLPDLWVINPRDKETKSVSVKIISGANWQTYLANTGTPLAQQTTDIYSFNFVVSDYNNDSYPDLWVYNHKSNRLQIISGDDLETELLNTTTGLPNTNSTNWVVLGSDRARETIAPAVPKLKSPKEGLQINDPNTLFRWKQAGLANRYTLTVTNSGGGVIATRDFTSLENICYEKFCSVTASGLGYLLNDDQSYHWYVVAHNNYGSTGSVTRSLTTDIPGVPVMVAPVAGEILHPYPVFQWQPQPTADKYKLVVKNGTKTFKFKQEINGVNCASELCTFTMTDPMPVDSYTWKVVAKNSQVNGKSKTEKRLFTVIPMPTPTPTIVPTDTPTTPFETSTPVVTETPTEAPTEDSTPGNRFTGRK